MLHILLIILKAAGILLLIVLGLLLLFILAVLLAPIRYRGEGSKAEAMQGKGLITWLNPFFRMRAEYEGKLKVTIRLLGIPILRIPSPGKESADETAEKTAEEDGWETDGSGETGAEVPGSKPQEAVPLSDPREEEILLSAQEHDAPENSAEFSAEEDAFTGQNRQAQEEKKKEQTSGGKFRRFLDSVSGKLSRAAAFRENAAAFLADEANQKTKKLLLQQLHRLLHHLKPKVFEGSAVFGLDDPYLMGQILAGAALFYPLYGDSFTLTPDFEQERLEGEIRIRGRIRVGTLAMIGIRILADRNFRTQIKKFMNRGGE